MGKYEPVPGLTYFINGWPPSTTMVATAILGGYDEWLFSAACVVARRAVIRIANVHV